MVSTITPRDNQSSGMEWMFRIWDEETLVPPSRYLFCTEVAGIWFPHPFPNGPLRMRIMQIGDLVSCSLAGIWHLPALPILFHTHPTGICFPSVQDIHTSLSIPLPMAVLSMWDNRIMYSLFANGWVTRNPVPLNSKVEEKRNLWFYPDSSSKEMFAQLESISSVSLPALGERRGLSVGDRVKLFLARLLSYKRQPK